MNGRGHLLLTRLLVLVFALSMASPAAWTGQYEMHSGHQQAEQTEHNGSRDLMPDHHGDPTAHRFPSVHKALELFENAERDVWQKPDEVAAHMRLLPGDLVIDLGAGTGYFARRFAELVGPEGAVFGLDVEASMVEYMNADAQKRGLKNYMARQVKSNDPQLSPGSANVIFICNTYHHLPDRVDYVRALVPALRSNGRVIVVDFKDGSIPIGPPPEWRLSSNAVEKEFQHAGLDLVRSVEFLPYQYFLEFSRPITD